MAFTLTAKNKSILKGIEKRPVVALDIEGSDILYTSNAVLEPIFYDEGLLFDDGLFWDGRKEKSDARSYIDLKESTNSITQKIYPDKEGASSISAATVKIVDENNRVARALSLDTFGELVGRRCGYYIGFQGGTWPDDFIAIYRGVITSYYYEAGAVYLDISHPEKLKNQRILVEYSSVTTTGIDSVQTNIPVETTSRFTPSIDCLTSYIRIDDEIMEVTGITSTEFTVVRGRLGSVATTHPLEADVSSVYQINEFPLTLAQKIMLSDGEQGFTDSTIELESFVNWSPLDAIPDAIFFNHPDIEEVTGLVPGDVIEIDTKGQFTIESFGKIAEVRKSYMVVEETLTPEFDILQPWRYRSQYNVLNFGLGMLPFQVDNISIDEIKRDFSPNFIQNTFEITETLDARQFINKELAFVSGCYAIPRNARASFKFLSPPLSIQQIPILDVNNIENMIKAAPKRSSDEYYYNNVVYKFAKSVFDGEFKSVTQFIAGDSINRFGLGSSQLAIEASGLKRTPETVQTITRLANAYLNRFRNTAPVIKDLKLSLSTGFNLDVGDVVYFGGSNTQLASFNTGRRDLPLEKYEVLNKKLDLGKGVTVTLLDTGFSTTGIYGVFSPASKISAATTTELTLAPPNNLDEVDNEPEKYTELIGARFLVRNEEYTYIEETTLLGISETNASVVFVDALPSVPPVDAIFELANHDTQPAFSTDLGKYIKTKYTFVMDQVGITSVTDAANFDVDDVTSLFVGQTVAVHSDDFVRDEENAEIANIVGNTITLTSALDFTPIIGDKLEQKSYEDQDGYLFL